MRDFPGAWVTQIGCSHTTRCTTTQQLYNKQIYNKQIDNKQIHKKNNQQPHIQPAATQHSTTYNLYTMLLHNTQQRLIVTAKAPVTPILFSDMERILIPLALLLFWVRDLIHLQAFVILSTVRYLLIREHYLASLSEESKQFVDMMCIYRLGVSLLSSKVVSSWYSLGCDDLKIWNEDRGQEICALGWWSVALVLRILKSYRPLSHPLSTTNCSIQGTIDLDLSTYE